MLLERWKKFPLFVPLTPSGKGLLRLGDNRNPKYFRAERKSHPDEAEKGEQTWIESYSVERDILGHLLLFHLAGLVSSRAANQTSSETCSAAPDFGFASSRERLNFH